MQCQSDAYQREQGAAGRGAARQLAMGALIEGEVVAAAGAALSGRRRHGMERRRRHATEGRRPYGMEKRRRRVEGGGVGHLRRDVEGITTDHQRNTPRTRRRRRQHL